MANEEEQHFRSRPHSVTDVWQAINKQGDDIANIRASLASLEGSVKSAMGTFGNQLMSLTDKVNRPLPEPDFKGWLTVAIAIALAMASLGYANLKPLSDKTDRNATVIEQITREVWEHKGYSDAIVRGYDHRVTRLESDSDAFHKRNGSARTGSGPTFRCDAGLSE